MIHGPFLGLVLSSCIMNSPKPQTKERYTRYLLHEDHNAANLKNYIIKKKPHHL